MIRSLLSENIDHPQCPASGFAALSRVVLHRAVLEGSKVENVLKLYSTLYGIEQILLLTTEVTINARTMTITSKAMSIPRQLR